MKFLANENIPLASIKYLKKMGFNIKSIGLEHLGITDKEVIAIANAEQRTIITFDRDYGELIFKHNLKPKNGVIYLRLSNFSPETPGKIIERMIKLKKFNFEGKITVVNDETIRQRKY